MKGNAPSRVIHIRNIPSDVTEAEIIHLGIPFGCVTNVLVLKGKIIKILSQPCSATLRKGKSPLWTPPPRKNPFLWGILLKLCFLVSRH